jgi:hypothetical protein
VIELESVRERERKREKVSIGRSSRLIEKVNWQLLEISASGRIVGTELRRIGMLRLG